MIEIKKTDIRGVGGGLHKKKACTSDSIVWLFKVVKITCTCFEKIHKVKKKE